MLYQDQRDASGGTSAPLSYTTVAYPYTGDYRIDTLIGGLGNRWNAGSPLGTPVTVTYSFMLAKPWYGGTDEDGDTGFSVFTPQQQAAARQIFAHLQEELDVRFVEVADSTYNYGQIRFGNNTQAYSAGYAWLPDSGDDRSGDVWLDNSVPYLLTQVTPGSQEWAVLVHEIGHALGLKHPGNYNAGQSATTEPGNYLGSAEDNLNYTIMSYTDAAGGQEREWYGMYDLLALKALYGAGDPNPGPTTYAYGNSVGRNLVIIDDASGVDTLDLSALTLAATVDLRPGSFSSVGWNVRSPAVENLSIDLSTVIEQFIGTSYADRVTGNDANNVFVLGGGANVADGGGGIDTSVYALGRAAYQLSLVGPALRVSGAGVDDALNAVERLAFSDQKLAFDLPGHAGDVAKLLGAVYGAESVRDHPDYVGIGLYFMDSGMSYGDLMQFALNSKLGTARTPADVVKLLYENVVGAPPSAADLAYYQAWLDSGAYSQAALGIYAAQTAQNLVNIDWVGLSAHGLDYV